MCKGRPLSRCGQGTIISLWHEGLWCEVAGALGSCLCRLCARVQLPFSSLGPHPDLCPQPRLCDIWSNWWPSSSATANNVNTLKLPQSISVLLNTPQLDRRRDCQEVLLNCQHFQVVSSLWCRSKAMSNPKYIFFWLKKVNFFAVSLVILAFFIPCILPSWVTLGVLLGWSKYDASLRKPRAQLQVGGWCRVSVKSDAVPLISSVVLDGPLRHPATARKLCVCLWLRALCTA